MNTNNIFLLADSYKISHWNMLPPKTNKVYSYVESRGGEIEETLFFGLQFLIKRLNTFFPTMEDVEDAKAFYDAHGEPFNYDGAKQLVDLGYFPLEIKAVKEGTILPSKHILVSITNTLDDYAWLPSFMETILLNSTWYPTTVASYSYACKKIISEAYDRTATEESKAGIPFALHDFGFRGASSIETAGIGGTAHLVNFNGSDTVIANVFAKNFYNEEVASFSVPAAEHSVITAWGKNNESDAYENIIDEYPDGIVSVVSDSYDIYNAVDQIIGVKLKDKILARDGVYVVRPDSGDPVTVLCGDKSITNPQDNDSILVKKGILQILLERFGGTVNDKGFKVLNEKIRVLQGDGINIHSLKDICDSLEENGWSVENMVFGMGGKLLQDHNRDTMKFACKCSHIEVDGEPRDVFKEPKTDSGKNSKRGVMSLLRENGKYHTVKGKHRGDLLETVYLDGRVIRNQSLSEIREMVR